MPLHINLYHEVQKQAALKRRDPLKLTMYGLGGIAVCLAGFYFIQLGRSHAINSEMAHLQEQFNQLKPKADAAKAREDQLATEVKLNDHVRRRVEDRFYWAPLLEQVVQVVPREVQITKLGGDVSGDAIRKCTLTLDGICAGTDPRKIAEDLRTSIAERLKGKYQNVTSTFKALDDGTEQVPLDGQKLATATFAINVAFNTGEDTAAQASAPVRKKR